MKPDVSKIFYEKYFSKRNRPIEVTLKNGEKITGIIISFFHGDASYGEGYIRKWHIVNIEDKHSLGINVFDTPIGKMILQSSIKQVKFLDDNSEMNFE